MGQRTAIIVQRKAENKEKTETKVFYCQWGIGRIMPSQLISILNGILSVSWSHKGVVEALKPQGTVDITDEYQGQLRSILNNLDFDHPEDVGEIIENASNNNGGIFIRFTTGGEYYDNDILSVEYAYMLGYEEDGDYKHFCTGEEWMKKNDPKRQYIDRKFKEMYKRALAYFEAQDRSTGEVKTDIDKIA